MQVRVAQSPEQSLGHGPEPSASTPVSAEPADSGADVLVPSSGEEAGCSQDCSGLGSTCPIGWEGGERPPAVEVHMALTRHLGVLKLLS